MPGQCAVTSAYTGDVTALCIARLPGGEGAAVSGGSGVLAGIGSQLHAYSLPSGNRCCCTTVLPDAARLHGIACLPEEAGSAACTAARPALLVAVHGGRHAALLRLLGPAAAGSDACASSPGVSGWEVQRLVQLPRFQHWTMDVQLSLAGSGSAVHLAVGLSSNAVEAFVTQLPAAAGTGSALGSVPGQQQQAQPPRAQRVLHAQGAQRCLLYSMVMLPRQQGDGGGTSAGQGSGRSSSTFWLVAGGTVFLDVLIWATPAAEAPRAAAAAAAAALASPAPAMAATLYRLKGHEGSIHRVRWSTCGGLLASASDDRSLRLWSIPPAHAATAGAACAGEAGAPATEPALLQPRHVLWGHTARLWDCCFGGGGVAGGSEGFLATVSEDCSCRLWCLATGQLLGTIKGHRGRGIWHCALLEPPQHARPAPASEAPAAAAASAAAAGCCLFTGGADGSIKCWRLADWLPSGSGGSAGAALPAAECFMLRGMPPDPAAVAVGSEASYGCDHHTHLDAAQQQQQQKDVHSESRTEWVRCLAMAEMSGSVGSAAGSSNGRLTRSRRRCVYVGTNRGLLHRVHLPDAEAGQEEWWKCLLKSGGVAGSGGKPMPLMSLSLLQVPAAGRQSADGSGRGSVWVATVDFGGTVTVLCDKPEPSPSPEAAHAGAGVGGDSSGGGSSSSRTVGPASCCSWQPYGPIRPGNVGIWWGSPRCDGGSSSSSGGLGSRCCFTARGGLLTLWLLPLHTLEDSQEEQQQRQQPQRLAEVRLPFAAQVTVLAAALLPPRYHQRQRQAALVAVGDTDGGIAVLLLLAPPGLDLGHPPAAAALAAQGPAAAAGAAAGKAAEEAAGEGRGAQLLVLAAARQVCDLTPVRMIRLHLPPPACGASFGTAGGTAAAAAAAAAAVGRDVAEQLAAAEVVVAGGSSTIQALRLPATAVATACQAAAGVAAPAAADAGGEPAGPPRLLCTRCRRYEAVTHIDGATAAAAGDTCGGGGSNGIAFGFHSSHFAVWDEGAEAEVARVVCGGARRAAAADVAGGDDLALCFVRDARLWLYRRRPGSDSGSAAPPPRCLHPPHHGLEQECIRLLHLPGCGSGEAGGDVAGPAAVAVCCLTGGTDGLLRQQLLALPGDAEGGLSGDGAFDTAAHLAEAVQGTAVKSLALLPLPSSSGDGASGSRASEQWLLLAAGAKQALMACRLRRPVARRSLERREGQGQQQQQQRRRRLRHLLLPLGCEELAVKELAAGPRRKPITGSQKLGSDQRYLSISAFLWQKPADRHQPQPQVGAEGQQAPTQDGTTQEACLPPAEASRQVLPGIAAHPVQVFVVAAASDASLALLTADLAGPRRQLGTGQRQQQWQEVAALRHHAYPVLCTVHCCLEVPSADLVGSGGNGSSSAASRRQHRHIICSGDTDGCVAVWDVTAAGGPLAAPAAGGAAAGASHAEPVEVQEVHPLLALEGVHQSGVNSVAAVAAGPGRLLLLTGGDDQALCFTLLHLGLCPAGSHASPGSGSGCACTVRLRLSIPNAHSSAVRSVWLGQQPGPPAQPSPPPPAVAPVTAVAFSVGLDQQVRCWRVRLEEDQRPQQPQWAAPPSTAGLPSLDGLALADGESGADDELWLEDGAELVLPWMDTARYRARSSSGGGGGRRGGDGGSEASLEVEEAGCCFTQVVEPAALDVLPAPLLVPGASPGHQAGSALLPDTAVKYLVGVAGRGTQLLNWQLPRPS